MNFVLLFVPLLVVLATAELSLDNIKNVNVTLPVLSQAVGRSFGYCTTDTPLNVRCSEDCESMELCIYGQVHRVNCLAQTGKRYCDVKTDSCTDKLSVCYNSRDFCPTDGLYPDLTDCQRYVHCSGKVMHPYQCLYNTIYEYKSRRCLPDLPCITFTQSTGCKGKTGLVVAHPLNPKWFVYCKGWGNPMLGACNGETYTFHEASGTCKFQCNDYGKYPDEYRPNVYYDCYRVNETWITNLEYCPFGHVYQHDLQVCIEFREPREES